MSNNSRNYKKIIESLKLLSIDFDDQKTFFPSFADVPDEILDTYYNAFLLIPDLVDDGAFSNSVLANLIRIQNYISTVMSQPSIQSMKDEEISSAREWIILKNMSRGILKLLGEPEILPDPDYL